MIGWAAVYGAPGDDPTQMDALRRDLVRLLVERGARHHIFSAIAVGDLDLVRSFVEQNPELLDRRLSRFEHGLTPLHFAINRKRHDILDVLIELGADLEAQDASGQTALALAMLRGGQEAMRRLQAAGAMPPAATAPSTFTTSLAALADSVSKGVPMLYASDVRRALEWYTSIGFKEIARYEDDGLVNFGMVSFGKAELMLNMHGERGRRGASLWFYTDRVDALYQLLKSGQLSAAHAALAGESGTDRHGVRAGHRRHVLESNPMPETNFTSAIRFRFWSTPPSATTRRLPLPPSAARGLAAADYRFRMGWTSCGSGALWPFSTHS